MAGAIREFVGIHRSMTHARPTIPPRRLLPPVGQCIWCGKSPPEVQLTEEHAIPKSFGGIWILPEGCCKTCEGDQSAYIGTCCERMFAALRLHHGLPVSRKRKRSARTVRILSENNEITKVPHSDAPGIVVLPYLDFPRLLSGAPARENEFPIVDVYVAPTTDDAAVRQKTLEDEGFNRALAYSEIPTTEFSRVVAHIAHCFYMTSVNSEREKSLMLPLAKGDLSRASLYLGGWPKTFTQFPPPPSGENDHQIIPFNARFNENDYVAAHIRLFTHLRPLPPVYTVILCERDIPRGEQYFLFERQERSEGINIEITAMTA